MCADRLSAEISHKIMPLKVIHGRMLIISWEIGTVLYIDDSSFHTYTAQRPVLPARGAENMALYQVPIHWMNKTVLAS